MSQNKNTTPSIDDLISRETSHSGDNINLDEFSLDNLSLDNFDTFMDKTPSTKTETQEISLDDTPTLDFGLGNTSKEPKQDGSDILDELEALSQNLTPAPSTGGLFDNAPSQDSLVELLDNAPNDGSLFETQPSESPDLPEPVPEQKEETPLAALAAPKPAKKSLFGGSAKKDKPAKTAKRATRPSKVGKGNNADSKRLMMIIVGALIALVALVGAWFFLQKEEELPAPPVPAVSEAIGEPAPEMPQEGLPDPNAGLPPTDAALDTSAIDAAAAGVADPNAVPPVVDTTAPAPTNTDTIAMPMDNTQEIDINAITQAEIPEDPTLIKEEIDRLKDKDEQFSEQAKLINEQLSLMQDLTKQKEEQIALIEKQIAQLEAEKGKK